MKRSRFGAVLLAGILVVGLFYGRVLHKWHHPVSEYTLRASELAVSGNWNSAQLLIEQARARWERYRHLSAAISNHRPMEEVDALFEELEIYSLYRDTVNYAAACSRIVQEIQGISSDSEVSWWNVF